MNAAIAARIGVEQRPDELNRHLCRWGREFGSRVMGAVHITCADETEQSCAESFQRCLVDDTLPELGPGRRAPFRLANAGAQHEAGAVAIAEQHFALALGGAPFAVLLVKVNAHVGVCGSGPTSRFGPFLRYGRESTACGALHALLAGADRPFLVELRRRFAERGLDRVALLLDERGVAPDLRQLYAAVLNAQLQARAAEDEIAALRPSSPTVFLVASAVTLNRPEGDSELLCGWTEIDRRGGSSKRESVQLGDDPRKLKVEWCGGALRVAERPAQQPVAKESWLRAKPPSQ